MNRNNRKQEVASKVKEIKQRQKNWMKQRAEYQETDEIGESQVIDSSRHSAPLNKTPPTYQSPKVKPTDQSDSYGNLLTAKKSKAKFENWLKAKHTESGDIEGDQSHDLSPSYGYHDAGKYNSDNYTDNQYGNNIYRDEPYRDHKGSKEVNILRVPSSRSPQYATPDPSYNSEDETGEITAAQLLSPGEFDSVADNIINRVKGDLGISGVDKRLHAAQSANRKSVRDEHYGKTRESKTGDGKSLKKSIKTSAGKANHVCPTCDKLMVPPHCSPMLLVPCGHTLCGQCSKRTKFCGMCGEAVKSFKPNIMLEEIITNYNSNHTAIPSSDYTYKDHSSHKDIRQYREEYHNLQTREDILSEECDNIDRNVIQLSQDISVQNQQIDKIQAQEEKVSSEIRSLQEKLQTLQSHRREYERSCDKLQGDYKQEKNKLLMIHESIESIKKQKEKIKLLAESEY